MRDFIVITLDQIEYFFRRLVCKIIGHRDEVEKEWAGDEVYFIGYTCKTCHRFTNKTTGI